MTKRIVLGITGASGVIYGLRLLEQLMVSQVETHLVITEAGAKVISLETTININKINKIASHSWNPDCLEAPISSGSYRTSGMVIAPCSIRTVSAVACSRSSNLLERAADVTLKERRPLILMVRETPLHAGHLRLMLEAAQAGAIIMPPMPAFYISPRSIDDLVDHSVGKILDLLDIENNLVKRWGEQAQPKEA